jgi:hypothetical protein
LGGERTYQKKNIVFKIMDIKKLLFEHLEKKQSKFEKCKLHLQEYKAVNSYDMSLQDSLILFHGTNKVAQEKILVDGFKLVNPKGVFVSNLIEQAVYYNHDWRSLTTLSPCHQILVCQVDFTNSMQRHDSLLYQTDYIFNLCETKSHPEGLEYRICNPDRIRVLGIASFEICPKDLFDKITAVMDTKLLKGEINLDQVIDGKQKLKLFGWSDTTINLIKPEFLSLYIAMYEEWHKTSHLCMICSKK